MSPHDTLRQPAGAGVAGEPAAKGAGVFPDQSEVLRARIAIIMPAYNAEAFIASAVDSVRMQIFRDWRLIVVDDGSTDRTAAIVQSHAERDSRIVLIRQSHAGCSAARNKAAEHICSSEYVALLDADDSYEPHALQNLLTRLESQSGCIAVHGQARYIDRDSKTLRRGVWPGRRWRVFGWFIRKQRTAEPTTFETLAFADCIPIGSVLIRREAFLYTLPFDSALSPAEDWDFFLRLSLLGNIGFLPEVVLSVRKHGTNASGRRDRMDRMLVQVRRKALGYAANPQPIKIGYRWFELHRAVSLLRLSLIACGRHVKEALSGTHLRSEN